MLKRSILAPAWALPDACTVHALQIDRQMQGQGLGRLCLHLLPQSVRQVWPELKRIMLAVDAHNQAAMQLYLKQGWQDNGKYYPGRVGLERRLTLLL
ncbi:acetyltransferase (GNAT) family protein [Pseudomonas duriflava]|uniref:Acetyltransferase (GNAT) family protein n=1 Tax=Pseudomonas duriflava TaxID=459528 RepID=A0A562QDX7_9PSED|nr:GNAT family N-acetyltransferase [Pseudomonas duriflava]TWI54958.1 acetyltransferase (GNAT) family protein [Pseudomonas duriflava]